MARFVSITAEGIVYNQQFVNRWWYEVGVNLNLTEDALNAYLNAWTTTVRAPLLAWLPAAYTLVKVTGAVYGDLFEETPILPIARDLSLPGARAGETLPTFAAAILAARVRPVRLAPRPGGKPPTNVRRGYWAFGPILEGESDGLGQLTATIMASAVYVNLRSACFSNLVPAAPHEVAGPIRVSQPLPETTPRGYGLVTDATWRPVLSTRRSRKVGVGA